LGAFVALLHEVHDLSKNQKTTESRQHWLDNLMKPPGLDYFQIFDLIGRIVDMHMSSQSRPSPRRQEAILLAAQRRFAQYGHAKVTMDEIAADVGMGKASLYYYFPTKEGLFRAVVEHEQKEFLGRMEPVLRQDSSSAEKLNDYLVRRMDYFRDFVNLSNLNIQAIFQPESIFAELSLALNAHDRRMIEAILQEGVNRGEFLQQDVKGHAELLNHLLQGLRLRLLRSSGRQSAGESYLELQRDLERLVQLVTRALRNQP
jgi:TetR/AcrR family transcriptional regulator